MWIHLGVEKYLWYFVVAQGEIYQPNPFQLTKLATVRQIKAFQCVLNYAVKCLDPKWSFTRNVGIVSFMFREL